MPSSSWRPCSSTWTGCAAGPPAASLTRQTLVDSIGAVEAAWGGVAEELGEDPEAVIAATHGRRAIDNLRDLKPELRRASDADMSPHVEEFETRILNNADEYQKEVRSRRESIASSRVRRQSRRVQLIARSAAAGLPVVASPSQAVDARPSPAAGSPRPRRPASRARGATRLPTS